MISSNISSEVSRTRIDDLRRQADEWRRAGTEPNGSRPAPRSGRRPLRSGGPMRAFGALRLRRA